MTKSRVVLKEIPANDFHSAIFTTYSLSLYYLEQQVLPLLAKKSINYVSILADSSMLTKHLENYSVLSQSNKRRYSLHGIQSKGAFHPKLIFLAGKNSVLVLLGSGNLTTSGHGKNLEVWNPIYVSDINDKKRGFILQVWHYLKSLHSDLGDSALNKLRSIEENSSMLIDYDLEDISYNYEINRSTKISFLSNQTNASIFQQISEVIGEEKISTATIMCPFHDLHGRFIRELNNRFKPNEIKVLIQKNYGSLPLKIKDENNIHFFDWKELMEKRPRQNIFHAKNIILNGMEKSYLISGSANASIQAFGSKEELSLNQEACILYESTRNNFLKLLGINLKTNPVNLEDYKHEHFDRDIKSQITESTVFIKSSERNYNDVSVLLVSKKDIDKALLKFYDSKRQIQFKKEHPIRRGENSIQLSLNNDLNLFNVDISLKEQRISNKQFITDINAFESTNPSPRNRELNKIKTLIESGDFSTPKIIDYLTTVYKQRKNQKSSIAPKKDKQRKNTLPVEEEDELLYWSQMRV